MTVEQFLSDLKSDSADARFAAWRAAGEVDPQALQPLAKLMVSSNPGVAKAAREALNTIVHSVGVDTANPKRAAVARELLRLAAPGQPVPVRTLALRSLSLIGGEEAIAPVAKMLAEPEIREEAVFCIERIPVKAADAALARAYNEVAAGFRPRILAALGHRKSEEGVTLCLEAMRSPDSELALAGVKALGRIGRKPAGQVKLPEFDTLSEFQKIEFMDSALRFADAMAAQGNHPDALKVYRQALERPEEHWQCAALVGIGKMNTPEAAAIVFTKLKSSNDKVRLTAAQVWTAMKDGAR